MPYVSKKDCDEMVKAERRYFDHKKKEIKLLKRYAESVRDRVLFEQTVCESKHAMRLQQLQQVEHSCHNILEDSRSKSYDLRIEWNLAGWRCHGKRGDRLLQMIEDEKNEILSCVETLESESELKHLKWAARHIEHHEQILGRLNGFLIEL
jgi:hypothetical protein